MKKVEKMSIEDMERYFRKIEKLKRYFGRSYRLFWPFKIFFPFSPIRLILNLGVLFTWLFLAFWFVFCPYSTEKLLFFLARFWIVLLIFSLIIGLFERHLKIKSRYRALSSSRFYHRTHHSPPPPPSREERPPEHHSQSQDDILYYGKEFLKRILK